MEWSIDNSEYTGNPFDVIATAPFTHTESGEERTTGPFYDGGFTWKLRFTGTRLGEWSLTTTSDDPELDGHNGTVTINPNSDPDTYGLVTQVGNKWARYKGNDGAVEPLVPHFRMVCKEGEEPPTTWDQSYWDEKLGYAVDDEGFNGIFLFVAGWWIDADCSGSQFPKSESDDPDFATFEGVARLLSAVLHAQATQGLAACRETGCRGPALSIAPCCTSRIVMPVDARPTAVCARIIPHACRRA